MSIELCARAKINLSLEVLGKRETGYHDLLSIMQSIDIYDKIYIEKSNSSGIVFETNMKNIFPEHNLAYKAAERFLEETKETSGCFIRLQKNIPTEAGMAGGSTDAAGVLRGLNKLFGFPLSREELIRLSKTLGADVPFCLFGGTAKAEGIGERLTNLPYQELNLLIVKPGSNISTKEVFSAIKASDFTSGENTNHAVDAILENDRETLYKNMVNGMYRKSLLFAPEMESIIATAEKVFGSKKAMMSGSGSTVFAIFEDEKKLKKAYEYFLGKYEQVYNTKSYHESISFY